MDRALDCGSKGCGFNSRQARKLHRYVLTLDCESLKFIRKESLIWRVGPSGLRRETRNFVSLAGTQVRILYPPPIFTFCEIVRNCLGAKRLGMVFFSNFEGIFEIARQRAVGNAEVPVRQHRENEVFRTNLFSFAESERLSVFFFDCPKTNLKTIWTT